MSAPTREEALTALRELWNECAEQWIGAAPCGARGPMESAERLLLADEAARSAVDGPMDHNAAMFAAEELFGLEGATSQENDAVHGTVFAIGKRCPVGRDLNIKPFGVGRSWEEAVENARRLLQTRPAAGFCPGTRWA